MEENTYMMANLNINRIKKFYYDFLESCGQPDSNVTRLAYYNAVLRAIGDVQNYDHSTPEVTRIKLRARISDLSEMVRQEHLSGLNLLD